MRLEDLAKEPQNRVSLESTTADLSIDPIAKRQEAYLAAEKRSHDICMEYQRNTIATEKLRAKILKGIKEGRPLAALFLDSMKALSICTKSPSLYDQVERDMTSIYAYGIQDPGAVEMEADALRYRIYRMRNALASAAVSSADKKNIEAAIKEHQKSLDYLVAKKYQQSA